MNQTKEKDLRIIQDTIIYGYKDLFYKHHACRIVFNNYLNARLVCKHLKEIHKDGFYLRL